MLGPIAALVVQVSAMLVREATEEFRGAVCTVAGRQRVVRLLSLTAAALALAFVAVPGQAQEWSQYFAFDDRFSVDFPGEPSIHETTYTTEFGHTLPARVYTAEDDFGTYSVTAVDWRGAQALHEEKFEACQRATGDLGGGDNPGHCSLRYARMEIRGVTLHAAFDFLERGSEVTHFGYTHSGWVEGIGIQLLDEDGSRSSVIIHWHDYRLYIAEAITPPGMPPPILFSTALSFLDEDGLRISYEEGYTPLFPATRAR
ncbi:MAG: hypothetical protein E2O65_05565 [Gammaproteobacteria bacterium]|nr:MAG: hypothetical protein E2O65_05565 [Gammaproteobacteria bacterium]